MLKHIVMWRFAPQEGLSVRDVAREMKHRLESLRGVVPQIIDLEVGVNVAQSDAAFDAVLVATFADKAALDAYKQDPHHREVSDFCRTVRTARVECDYEL